MTHAISNTDQATDGELLSRFAAAPPDQAAFEELTRRHIDWIYATALRITRDSALADDITQAVLWSLARKAPQLAKRSSVGGWLHEATRYAATTLMRGERRRKERERMTAQHSAAPEGTLRWEELEPRLDAALARLPAHDREALLLRYLQRKSHKEIGAAMGTTEEAARKRVNRAIHRLRTILGVGVSVASLGSTLGAAPPVSAPPHLTSAVMGGTISARAALLAKGVVTMHKVMTLKIALSAAVLAVSAAVALGMYANIAHGSPSVPVPGGGGGAGAQVVNGGGAAAGGDAQAVPGVVNVTTADGVMLNIGTGVTISAGTGGGGDAATSTSGSDGRTVTRPVVGGFPIPAGVMPNMPMTTTSPRVTVMGGTGGTGGVIVNEGGTAVMMTGGSAGGGVGGRGRAGTALGTGWMLMTGSADGSTSTKHFNNGQYDIALSMANGTTNAVIKDAAGKVIYEGPYNTEAEKAKVPAEVRTVVDAANVVSRSAMTPIVMGGLTPGRQAVSVEMVRAQLEPSEQEWPDMEERIKLILTLQGYLATGNSATPTMPARVVPADAAANPITLSQQELAAALADKAAKEEDIEAKMNAVRTVRNQVEDSLSKTRRRLEESVTTRQKALLINLGIL